MALGLLLVYLVFSLMVLSHRWPAWVWASGSIFLILLTFLKPVFPVWSVLVLIVITAGISTVCYLPQLRRMIEKFIYKNAKHSLPKLSRTEEEALSVGDTWFEADIFRGEPAIHGLAQAKTVLTVEEQSFLDNEVQELCKMIDDWTISQKHDLPESVWQFIKDNGFFGLVIDKTYGGKGFSARAHSEIVMKIASRSGAAAVTVMVPNSLGPGELLQHYGTDEQKNHYLPRLAKGIDIPCFALTEPTAGSDATSIQSDAVVFEHTVDGVKQLALRISLNKRWITLSPVATLIGLAVNLKDPKGLLKGEGEEGITCILISRDTPNLIIGNRHLPANQAFMNGTIRGDNIIAPIETIIGGQKNAGNGWHMLVECLSIGRSISLPALATATSAVSYLSAGAFARLRRQFGVEIAQFEGIEEKLAEIAGIQYMVNATRLMTLAAVDSHKKPSVASAIIKYFNTESGRIVLNHAMDIHAGRAVVIGPRNYLANPYQSVPISITVEGANIMSRNLLIFGQGSMACHPFVREEFYAINKNDEARFSELLWKHIQYFMSNCAKTISSVWTNGWLISSRKSSLKRQYQILIMLSRSFAWIADFALISLGGELKRKERLSARLADAMSYLYMAMASLAYYEETDAPNADDALHAEWATQYCFYHAQKAMIDFCRNFPHRGIGGLIRCVAFPFGQTQKYPSDKLSHQLALLMTTNNHYRQTIKNQIFMSNDPKEPLDKMENAFQALIQHGHLYAKIKDLRKVEWVDFSSACDEKVKQGTLTQEERDQLISLEKLRWDAMSVDEFDFEEVKKGKLHSLIDTMPTPFDEKSTKQSHVKKM